MILFMRLQEAIQKIKTGDKEDIKAANIFLKSFWNDSIKSKRKSVQLVKVYISEFRNFNSIQNKSNQIAFISLCKWAFMHSSDDEKYFKKCQEFVMEIIQHPSGHIRHAMVWVADYITMGLCLKPDSFRKNITPEKIKEHQRLYGELIDEVYELCDKYFQKRFGRIKYIQSLPLGVYKSLQFLSTHLMPSEYFENAYREYLQERHLLNDYV